MAKRLPDRVLRSDFDGVFCRNCGGEIIVEPADHRSQDLPHRKVCRKCGAEYGTTATTLYPSRKKYDLPKPGFQGKSTWM